MTSEDRGHSGRHVFLLKQWEAHEWVGETTVHATLEGAKSHRRDAADWRDKGEGTWECEVSPVLGGAYTLVIEEHEVLP